MTRTSCIVHPPQDSYVRRRKSYVGVCEGDTCAAELLDLFQYWTDCKLERVKEVRAFNEIANRLSQPTIPEPDLWLYERIQDFKEALVSGFAETSIKKAIKFLKIRGFIKDKPSPTKFDNTKLYLLCIEPLQLAINNWHKVKNAETHEKPDETKTSDDQTETSQDETDLSQERTETSQDETDLSDISNIHTQTLSNPLTHTSSPNPANGEKQNGQRGEGTSPRQLGINPRELGTNPRALGTNPRAIEAKPPLANINPTFSLLTAIKPDLVEKRTVAVEDKNSAGGCDNSAFVGHGNIAPDGKSRPFNQRTAKWHSISSDPWMNGCNPDREFKKWVCDRAIASGKNYSLSDAAGEIRNNFQRASDLWEEYLEDLDKTRQNEVLKDRVKAQEEPQSQVIEEKPQQTENKAFLFYRTAIRDRNPMLQQFRSRGIEWAKKQPDVVLIYDDHGEVTDIEEF